MTSSINVSVELPRKRNSTTIWNRTNKTRFWWYFWWNRTKRKGTDILIFLQAYGKVRKLTEGQIRYSTTISAVLIQILHLIALITPRWISERPVPLFCVSVDKSRNIAKTIFQLWTVIITYFEIIEYLVSYASHFEGLIPKISKI